MKNNKTYGFTLLELVIVLGVMVVVSSAVVVGINQNSRRHLNNASLALQADLRYAQRRAIAEGRRFTVAFEPRQNRYHIMKENHGSNMTIIRTIYFENGAQLVETSHPTLSFLPRGTASSGFRINLRNGGYWQRTTATVSGGRIRVFDITTINVPGYD